MAHSQRVLSAGRLTGIALVLMALGSIGAVKSENDTTKAATDKTPPKKLNLGKANDYGITQVAFINEQIRQGWHDQGLTPSAAATDGEWCRRVFLDVLGRIPSVNELNTFLTDTTANKKSKLVDRLLGDDSVEEYARNWTTLWTNILIGRSGGTEERTLVNRAGLQQSLRRAFQRDMTYDQMVYELVSAKGLSRPGDEGFNGFVNFLAGNLDDHGIEATAKTSQIFLGIQVRCTQCHNHPFNDWKQSQFWGMNAFFRQSRALRRYEGGRRVTFIDLTNEDFAGEDNNPKEAALFYELRNGNTVAAYPVFVDGTRLASNSGYLDEVDRRKELAKLVVRSEYLAKAVVNRLWGHFLGYGFTKPIDDMGPHNAPTHPELLDGLAKEFKGHSYDLKQLIRWITLGEAYSLSSKYSGKNKQDDPTLGEKPSFTHFYLRQMRAEELYESLITATEAQKAHGSYDQQESTKHEWLKQFTIAFGTDDNEETTTFNGTIPQTLMMMNGDLVHRATSTDKGGFLSQIAVDPKMNNAAKINYLYLAALARKPTGAETGLANQLMAARKGNATEALQDVWWTLLNSNEFILNH